MASIREITLYKTEGSADKFYSLSIEPAQEAELFNLYYTNGRRGAAANKKLKIATPSTLDVVNIEFDKVQRAKMKDGYTPDQSGAAYTNTVDAGRVSGYLPMLPADLPKANAAQALKKMLAGDDWVLQEKMDGVNRILIVENGEVRGTNKKGLLVPIPESWLAAKCLDNCVIYGEQIGETLHAFDMHHPHHSFGMRFNSLHDKLKTHPLEFVQLVPVTAGQQAKAERLAEIDQNKGEGVVLKNLHEKFVPGKNEKTFRYKLWESLTCVVTDVNAQRSVRIGAYDKTTKAMIPLGSVTVPSNQSIPVLNDLVEVRYLYWNEGGALIQPTLIGARDDVDPAAATIDQITRIKPKGEPMDLDNETLPEQFCAYFEVHSQEVLQENENELAEAPRG